jgi:adenylate cyclase
VRKSGNRIRVTAQLIDARSDTHLWSQTFERQLNDIFTIQDDIAGAIVEQLKLTLVDPLPSRAETNPETYDLYLRAREAFLTRTPEGNAEALELLQRALVLDSNYAPAWSALGQAYLGDRIFRPMPYEESVPLARKAAETALQIDPNDWGAHHLLIFIALVADRDLRAAARQMQIILSSGRIDANVLGTAAMVAKSLGRVEDTIDILNHAIARDPLDQGFYIELGMMLYYSGDVEEAEENFRKAISLAPNTFVAHSWLAAMLLFQERYEEAKLEVAKEPWDAARLCVISMIYHDLGDEEKSVAALDQMLELPIRALGYGPPLAYAYRGDNEAAIDWLESNADQLPFSMLSEGTVSPVMNQVARDPRYRALLRKLGIANEQLAEIEFTVHLPESD